MVLAKGHGYMAVWMQFLGAKAAHDGHGGAQLETRREQHSESFPAPTKPPPVGLRSSSCVPSGGMGIRGAPMGGPQLGGRRGAQRGDALRKEAHPGPVALHALLRWRSPSGCPEGRPRPCPTPVRLPRPARLKPNGPDPSELQ